MAGSDPKNTWYNSSVKELEQLLQDDGFLKIIGQIKNPDSVSGVINRINLGTGYSMSVGTRILLKGYLETGKIPAYDKKLSPVRTWAPGNKTFGNPPREYKGVPAGIMIPESYIFLVLSPDTSRSDMEVFLRDHWQKDVEPEMLKLKQKLKNMGGMTWRDREIVKRKKAGESATKLANDFGISIPRVYQILKLYSEQK